MPSSDATTTRTLDVPGARLHYEVRGSGPVLVLIGAPMDSTGFAGIAGPLADDYTVVTYDPRGISRSTCDDPTQDVTPEIMADDVYRVLSAVGTEPAYVYGSSGGAVTGLALVTGHPGSVHTLVAHEPPVIELLPDSAQVRAAIEEVYDTYRSDGPEAAMRKFAGVAGVQAGPGAAASTEPDGMRANREHFMAHMIRPITYYRPEIPALRAASTRIVVGGGIASKGQLAHRTASALTEELGSPLVDFPGDHGGFVAQPEPFAQALRRVLTATT